MSGNSDKGLKIAASTGSGLLGIAAVAASLLLNKKEKTPELTAEQQAAIDGGKARDEVAERAIIQHEIKANARQSAKATPEENGVEVGGIDTIQPQNPAVAGLDKASRDELAGIMGTIDGAKDAREGGKGYGPEIKCPEQGLEV